MDDVVDDVVDDDVDDDDIVAGKELEGELKMKEIWTSCDRVTTAGRKFNGKAGS